MHCVFSMSWGAMGFLQTARFQWQRGLQHSEIEMAAPGSTLVLGHLHFGS